MFTQKPLVTLEAIETALRGTWDSEELNPIFFDHNERKQDSGKDRKSRESIINFCQAFGLPHDKAIQESGQPKVEEIPIEEVLALEGLEHYLSEDLTEEQFIKEEFQKFMSKPGYYEMNQALGKLERISNQIEKRLNANCFRHYPTIAKGLNNIEELSDDNIVNLVKIQVSRNLLSSSRSSFCNKALATLRLKKQSDSTKSYLQLTEKIYAAFGSRLRLLADISIDVDTFQFLKCHKLIRAIMDVEQIWKTNNSGFLNGLKAFSDLSGYVENKTTTLKDIIKKNWRLLHENYNEEAFYNNMLSQCFMERRGEIGSLETLKNELLLSILDDKINWCLREAATETKGVILNIEYINTDEYLVFLKLVFSEFSKLMLNYHSISRWFVKFDPSETTCFLQTEWEEDILCASETLTSQQQRQAFLEFVQQKKNAYLQDRKDLWKTIEEKVQGIISNSPQIDSFSQEQLVSFLKLSSEFIGTGIQYSNSQSNLIRSSVNSKISSYYEQFMIKLQNDLIQSLTAENWERSKDEEIANVQRELQSLGETPSDSEYINSIQFILPELKIESIETYSPQNHSKFLFHSPSPSLTRVDSLPSSSPNLKPSSSNFPNDYEPKKIDFKLHKCSSPPNEPVTNTEETQSLNSPTGNIPQEGGGGKNLEFQCGSSILFIKGIVNSLRLISILYPVQQKIYESLAFLIDFYIYSLFRMLCDKQLREKIIKKLVLEHVNVNKDNMIDDNESKFDFLMDSLMVQRKYAKSKYFFTSLASKFNDDAIPIENTMTSSNDQNHNSINATVNPAVTTTTSEQQKEIPFQGLTLVTPTQSTNNKAPSSNQIAAQIIATESFLELVEILTSQIKPFLAATLKDQSDIINDKFKIYEEIKLEFVEICYQSFLPSFLKSQPQLETILGVSKWDIKEPIKEFKPSPYTSGIKMLLIEQQEAIKKTCPKESHLKIRNFLNLLLVDYLFKSIVDTYAKLKYVNSYSKGLLILDIRSISADIDSALTPNTKPYKQYLDKYLELLQVGVIEEIHTQMSKLREIFPLRVLASLFLLSEVGINASKKKRQENQILALKGYQLYLREVFK